jgi:hypothetical protein
MLYANAQGVCPLLAQDLFIPWQRVPSMAYFNQRQARLADLTWVGEWGGGFADPCIVLKVDMDPGWPPPASMRHNSRARKAKPGEIYLNASVCWPGGEELWKRLKAVEHAVMSEAGQDDINL